AISQSPVDRLRGSIVMNRFDLTKLQLSRRAFLGRSSAGMGMLALAQFLDPGLLRAEEGRNKLDRSRGVVNPLHVAPKAKRVIWLCMAGGPSHLETFDYRPKLAELHG